jgi:hypothetical protein
MHWQRRYIREGETWARGGTYRLDLPDSGFLGSIVVRVDGTCQTDAAIAAEKWRIIDYISKIQVIANGSKVIKDLTGRQLQALNWYDQGVMPNAKWNEYASAVQQEYFLLNFGRYLHDDAMGLDLSRFDTVQLVFTNNTSSTYYSADWTISTLGEFKRDGGAFPLGYVRSEEYKTWSATADTWEYNDLPTEGKLRRLCLELEPDLGDTYNEFETSIDNMGRDVKITLDSGQEIVYEGGVDDLLREINLLMGRDVMVYQIPYRTARYAQRNGLGRCFAYAHGPQSASDTTAETAIATINTDYDRGTWGLAGSGTLGNDSFIGIGAAPHAVLWVPFNLSDDPADWIDLASRKTLKVDIHAYNTSGATGGACSLILERQQL